jgi:hypothetical protein
MIADLLTKLEEEKDQWINQAIARFNEGFLRVDGQRFENDQGLIGVYGSTQIGKDELSAVRSPEDRMMQIKNIEHSIRNQKNLDLERMKTEIKVMEESLKEVQQSYEELTSASRYLQEELEFYETQLEGWEGIQIEKFQCILFDKFTFDDKKDQVVFKERKISKLKESFQMVELEMLDFYHKQLSNCSLLIEQKMQMVTPSARFDFQTNPPIFGLSLKHGRGLDQYLNIKHFEEDYSIVLDTLVSNNNIAYEYYLSQINDIKRNSKKELLQLWVTKKEHHRLAEETIREKQEQKRQKEASLFAIQEKLNKAKREWNQDLKRQFKLDELLKDEFVKVVSGWQERLFAENTTDFERWAYHNYCQIILKQAERIIEND